MASRNKTRAHGSRRLSLPVIPKPTQKCSTNSPKLYVDKNTELSSPGRSVSPNINLKTSPNPRRSGENQRSSHEPTNSAIKPTSCRRKSCTGAKSTTRQSRFCSTATLNLTVNNSKSKNNNTDRSMSQPPVINDRTRCATGCAMPVNEQRSIIKESTTPSQLNPIGHNNFNEMQASSDNIPKTESNKNLELQDKNLSEKNSPVSNNEYRNRTFDVYHPRTDQPFNRIRSSYSSGSIPNSIANSSPASVISTSSTTLQDFQDLHDSGWAARAASIALSLTRVNPTIPQFSPRRSVSPSPLLPTSSAPHSPHLSHSRFSLPLQCHSTPPSPHQTSRIHNVTDQNSPIGHSLSPFLSPQATLSPGHSMPPSPIMPRALSPRRHSSPGHSLPTSPNMRPRSTQRNRSQRTPSPRPPLPPSTSHELTPHQARNRQRVEFGTTFVSKMRGR